MTKYIKKEELAQIIEESKNSVNRNTILEECYFLYLFCIFWVLLIFLITTIITISLALLAMPFVLIEIGFRKLFNVRRRIN